MRGGDVIEPPSILDMLVDELRFGVENNIKLHFRDNIEAIPVHLMSKKVRGSYGSNYGVPIWVLGYYFQDLADMSDESSLLVARFHPMYVVVTVTCEYAYRGDIFLPSCHTIEFAHIDMVRPDLDVKQGSVFGNGPIIEEKDYLVIQ